MVYAEMLSSESDEGTVIFYRICVKKVFVTDVLNCCEIFKCLFM